MPSFRIRKNKEKSFSIDVYNSEGKNPKSYYNNLIKNDPNIISQILIDLWILGFDIKKAVQIFIKKMNKEDWIGV